jgi:hypothetical protein
MIAADPRALPVADSAAWPADSGYPLAITSDEADVGPANVSVERKPMRKIIIAAAVALPIAGVAAYALAATAGTDAGTTGNDTVSVSTSELASADQPTVKPHKRLSIKGVFGDDDQGGGNEGIEPEGGEAPDSE